MVERPPEGDQEAAEKKPADAQEDPPPPNPEDAGLPDETIEAVREALDQGDVPQVESQLAALHPADVADILEICVGEERALLVQILGAHIDPEILSHLEPTVREEVIEQLGPENLARVLMDLDSDDAVEIFEDLEEDSQSRILAKLPFAYRHILQEGLSYPEDSAGRLMAREFVAVPQTWTIGQTIDYLRAAEDLPDIFYDLYVVNPKHKPLGMVPLSRAIGARRPERIYELIEEGEMHSVPLTMDQEEVAYLFRQYGLASAPVVDDAGRLVGTITVDDIVHVIHEEADEDMLRMAGVGETTIERVVALAVLMPIVASMGGNAGTQTLTVAVRAMAMKDLGPWNALRFVGKELLVGGFNGVVFAILMGTIAWLWFDDHLIGLIIGIAMIVNLIVAAAFGTLIPLTLERFKVDPAVASGVFLTTVTDVVGFFAFLGLAALVLL